MKVGHTIILILLAVLTLVSLILGAVAISGVLWLRQIALVTVAGARAAITDIGDDTFSYTITVDQEIPVVTTVPINEEVTLPIQTVVPISTVVAIPINAGLLGTFNIDVPVQTVIPVDLEFTVPVSQTVEIATTVPLSFEVPVEIPLADTPLVSYLEELGKALAQIEAELERPLGGED